MALAIPCVALHSVTRQKLKIAEMRTILAATKSIRIQSCIGFMLHKTAKDKNHLSYKQISVNVIDT